jgi:hypothetical protein
MDTAGTLSKDSINQPMSYEAYLKLLDELMAVGKTTGENHSEDMLNYTKMNIQRMKRLNKTVHLNEELAAEVGRISEGNFEAQTWFVITEAWCGDAAQNLPVIHKIAESCNKVELILLLRDENLEVMDQFLTNGGRSIPKLIVTNAETNSVLGDWGPRPENAQSMVMDFKKIPNGDYKEFVKEVQLWYAKDKTLSQQNEFVEKLQKWFPKRNK